MAEVMTDQDVDDLVTAAANLGLFFTGVPEDEMLCALPGLRAHMEAGISEQLGVAAEIADLIAESFVATVVRRRREIEAVGEMPRAMKN
jgi:hypothetical protein